MKPTKDDLEMFDALAGSNHGARLVDYLTRLQAHVCDSRTWAADEDKSHANKVSSILQAEIINRIRSLGEEKIAQPYPYV